MRQAERRARTVGALLDAAEVSFARSGYEGATLDSVAAAAGVSKGAVYAHFTSKLEILGAALDRAFAGAEERLARAASALRAGQDPASAARAYFGSGDDAVHVGLMAETWQVAILEESIRQKLDAFRSDRLAHLGQAAVDGGLAPGEALQVANITVRLIDGFTVEHRLKLAESA